MIRIRTCIVCRDRFSQFELIRLKCLDKSLIMWDGVGRSFYLCKVCLKDSKKVLKSIYKECKHKDKSYETKIEELKSIWIR